MQLTSIGVTGATVIVSITMVFCGTYSRILIRNLSRVVSQAARWRAGFGR
jgi:hypothetical protein